MPLYIAQSGDLDRCYRCLTHSQILKDRATQLLIKYKSGASQSGTTYLLSLVYQHYLLAKSKGPMTMTNQLCPHYCGVHCVRQMHFPIYVQLHVIVSGRIEKSDWGSS